VVRALPFGLEHAHAGAPDGISAGTILPLTDATITGAAP